MRQAGGWASSGSIIALMSLGTLWIALAFVLLLDFHLNVHVSRD